MADIELLHAIGQMLDTKLQPVCERLDRMDERLDGIDERLDCIDKRLTNLEAQVSEVSRRVKRLELMIENEIKPRLRTIEECYLSTYRRYVEYSEKMKNAFVDIDILKKTVQHHSVKLQSAT